MTGLGYISTYKTNRIQETKKKKMSQLRILNDCQTLAADKSPIDN